MGKVKRNARKTLEVKIMFEPSRLATEHLADAYRQLVPPRSRKVKPCKDEPTLTETDAEMASRRRS